MKKLIFLLLIIGLAMGGYYYKEKIMTKKKVKKKKMEYFTSKKGNIEVKIDSTGRVIPNQNIEIKCKASGEIIALPYDISDQVKKGDLLVKLDPVDEKRKVKLAEVALSSNTANLVQAKCNLKIAEKRLEINRKKVAAILKAKKANLKDKSRKFDRIKKLLKKKLSSQEEYDTSGTALIQARSDLTNAEAQESELIIDKQALELKQQDIVLAKSRIESQKVSLDQAKQRLEETKIFAPIDGAVTVRNVQIGQIISSGISNVGGGTTLMTLSDMSKIFVMAFVDETDIGRIEVGQKVRITVDAYPGVRFRGKIVQIALQGVNSSNVVTFEVKIEVKGRKKKMLKLEMTANVEIIVESSKDTILVKQKCVEKKKGHSYVKVKDESGKLKSMTVETGISSEDMIEIKTGLGENKKVLISDNKEIKSRWSTKDKGKRRASRMMRRMGGK